MDDQGLNETTRRCIDENNLFRAFPEVHMGSPVKFTPIDGRAAQERHKEQIRELRQINANLVAAVNSLMSIDAKLEMWMDEQMHEPEHDVLNPQDTL